MGHSREGLLAVHAAVLIFGFTALFSKLLSLPALDITLYRSVFAFFAIALYIAFKKQNYKLRCRADYLMVIMLGVFLAIHWVTYFYAMQVSSVAIGVVALYTYPVITVFLEPLFHGERPHVVDVAVSLIVLAAIAFMVPAFSLENDVTLGIIAGVFSAFMISMRNIMQKKYFSGYTASQALFYQVLVVSVVLFSFAETPVINIDNYHWGLLILLGVMFTAVPHTLFAHGLIHLKAKTASLIACVQVVYAALFAAVLLGEMPSINVVIGGAVVICAAVYESLPAKGKQIFKVKR